MLTPAEILGPDGLIAARLPHYEPRSQQLEMAEAVATALDGGHHAVIEAGTGVGKSFAYLVPVLLAVTRPRGEDEPPYRVVVSTHTISLQEQLMAKDLPFLEAVIPCKFSAVLVKGRGNYLSRRRLELATRRARDLFSSAQELNEIRQLGLWANESTDGSRSDLLFRPDPAVWDEVASDESNCLGRECRTYEHCFYQRARRRMHDAQILVVNHALFFTDLALRRRGARILPDYQAVVLDEAHTVEQVAADHLGIDVSSGQVEFTLNRLYNDRVNRGLLVSLKLREAQEQVLRCHYRCDEYFDQVRQWLEDHPESNGRVPSPGTLPDTLGPGLKELAGTLKDCANRVDDESARKDLAAARERLISLQDELHAWTSHGLPDAVYWIERSQRGRRHRVTLSAAPIHVGALLREQLFNRIPTVVMTSATLAVGRPPSFAFFRSRVGLVEASERQLGSPFDFRRQARLILVKGMPDPTTAAPAFAAQCSQMIRRYVSLTEGRAFVLFTSYSFMRQIAAELAGWFTCQDLTLFSQADGLPRTAMLDRFKQNPRSVLFGTDSFWHGVDVPGDALQNVIITRLPFSVPDQPLLQARLEAIRDEGGNPFMNYQVPEAVIKLRQGFGRLIRSHRDHGIVVILDPRITTKPYGRVFLQSLPVCTVIEESC